MKKCLIIIDVQNDFVTGSLGTREAEEMIPRLKDKLNGLKDTAVFFTQDTHFENYLETQEGKNLPIKHCLHRTFGWEIAEEIYQTAESAALEVRLVEKNTFGAANLPELLEDFAEIELVGLCTDICVISNALLIKAHYPEKIIAVDSACCAGTTPENHQKALDIMKICQIAVK